MEVHVHRQDGSLFLLREGDSLDGETVLQGFRCPVGEVCSDYRG